MSSGDAMLGASPPGSNTRGEGRCVCRKLEPMHEVVA